MLNCLNIISLIKTLVGNSHFPAIFNTTYLKYQINLIYLLTSKPETKISNTLQLYAKSHNLKLEVESIFLTFY